MYFILCILQFIFGDDNQKWPTPTFFIVAQFYSETPTCQLSTCRRNVRAAHLHSEKTTLRVTCLNRLHHDQDILSFHSLGNSTPIRLRYQECCVCPLSFATQRPKDSFSGPQRRIQPLKSTCSACRLSLFFNALLEIES